MQNTESFDLPARASLQPSGLYLELRDIGPEQLQDPFMHETVQRVSASPHVVQIAKADLGKTNPNSTPAGLIFHMGRCGSTLASQLLKCHREVVVYSELLSVNDILVPPHHWDRSDLVSALRSLGDSLAQHAKKPYVLKLSSWNTLFCDILADAFPSTPWSFCIRDPLEVCVSLLQQRPGWLRDAGMPSHIFAEFVNSGQACLTTEDYLAQLLASYFRAIGRMDRTHANLIHYEELPNAVWDALAPHFGLAVDEQTRSLMLAGSRAHSKSRLGESTVFSPDVSRKRGAASPELRRAIDAYARPELERLLASFY